MNKRADDDYKVIFGGTTISKKEAKRVGVAFIFGAAGIAIVGLTFGLQSKSAAFTVSLTLAGIGYFGIATKIYK